MARSWVRSYGDLFEQPRSYLTPANTLCQFTQPCSILAQSLLLPVPPLPRLQPSRPSPPRPPARLASPHRPPLHPAFLLASTRKSLCSPSAPVNTSLLTRPTFIANQSASVLPWAIPLPEPVPSRSPSLSLHPSAPAHINAPYLSARETRLHPPRAFTLPLRLFPGYRLSSSPRLTKNLPVPPIRCHPPLSTSQTSRLYRLYLSFRLPF